MSVRLVGDQPSAALLETIRVYETETRAGPGGLAQPLGHHIDTDTLDTIVESHPLLVVGLRPEAYHVEISEDVVHVTVSDTRRSLRDVIRHRVRSGCR